MRATTWLRELHLRYPFGIARGSADSLPTVFVELADDDVRRGLGEASPVRYLGISARDHLALVHLLAGALPPGAAVDPPRAIAAIRHLAGDGRAALAAIDIALWDLSARAYGLALHRLIGAPPPQGPTSYTVALDTLEGMEARAREASHLPRLKVKLGRDPEFDTEAIARVAAAAPRARLWVDANGGWTLAEARRILPHLVAHRVELVEQPLPRGALWQLSDLRRGSPLPLIADEDAQDLQSLPALRGRVDGINIKLMKCGGISEALAMIAFARREGWTILLGCNIEGRIGLAAAAALSGLVDAVDLDAHLLTTGDPLAPPAEPGPRPPLAADLPGGGGPGLGIPLEATRHLGPATPADIAPSWAPSSAPPPAPSCAETRAATTPRAIV